MKVLLHEIPVYQCIKTLFVVVHTGEISGYYYNSQRIEAMVECTQRSITYSDSMYTRVGYSKGPHLIQLLRCTCFVTAFFKIMLLPTHVPEMINKTAGTRRYLLFCLFAVHLFIQKLTIKSYLVVVCYDQICSS